jgi:hypothetical protein
LLARDQHAWAHNHNVIGVKLQSIVV